MQGGSQPHYLLGLRILNMLVSEMNAPTAGRSLTQHRKIAVNFRLVLLLGAAPPPPNFKYPHAALFSTTKRLATPNPPLSPPLHPLAPPPPLPPTLRRDQSLFKVFQLALTALRHLGGPAAAAADDKLREQAVQLALQCLSFDFVGTCLDESSEDLGTIQVPSGQSSWRAAGLWRASAWLCLAGVNITSAPAPALPYFTPPSSFCIASRPCGAAWRPSIEDPSTLQLFTDFYTASQPPLSNMALECLVRRGCLPWPPASSTAMLPHLLLPPLRPAMGGLHCVCHLDTLHPSINLPPLPNHHCRCAWPRCAARSFPLSRSAAPF